MLAGIYSEFQHWGNQTVWIYSDPHFGDKDLECGIENRPSTEEQIKMINSCVGSKDTIIFLGDIGDVEAIKQIRGYKVLIMGNHDAGKSNYEKDILLSGLIKSYIRLVRKLFMLRRNFIPVADTLLKKHINSADLLSLG